MKPTAQVHPLFPIPLFTTTLNRAFTEDELDFILNLDKVENTSNYRSKNTRVLGDPRMSSLRDNLQSYIDAYVGSVINPKEKLEVYLTQSWVNFTEPGQSHPPHKHPNSFISGVLYIRAKPDCDRITFVSNLYSPFSVYPKESGLFTGGTCDVSVTSGQLLIFPSDLSHGVEKTIGYDTRVSLSFNTFLKGTLGSDESLTCLILP